jgi:cell division protein FtsW (lipid II flippase)
MEMSWGEAIMGFGWLLGYGLSMLISATQKSNSKRLWKSVTPYLVSVIPSVYNVVRKDHDFFDQSLFAIFFFFLTWFLILSLRKQVYS